MSEAAHIRKLWEKIEADAIFPVQQVVMTPQWALLVSVPWCRFAREIRTEAQYAELLKQLKRPAAPTATVPSQTEELQLDLF